MDRTGAAVTVDSYHHHQVEQAVLAPASQPAHLPVIEAGTQLYRVTEAEELRFQHCVDRGADQHIHCSGEERSQARITTPPVCAILRRVLTSDDICGHLGIFRVPD